MDQGDGELTLADILADPVTLALMDADGVDPVVLAATLSQKAGDLMRPADPVNRRRRVTDGEVDKAIIAKCEADISVESRKSVAMARSPRAVRNTLRLASALVLLAFVVCHLTAHSFLLISLERAGAALDILMYPWRTAVGTAILVSALLAHYSNALWSIYVRRSLRLSRWEWWQLALGLCIPLLLMLHVVGTRIAEGALGVTSRYSSVLLVQWQLSPWLGVLQVAAVLTV